MIAPVLTSLPTPAATAPGRAAAALGQGSGAPSQDFSALLDVAQAPVQTPVQAPVQTPAQPLALVSASAPVPVPVPVPASVDLLPATAATPALPPPAMAAQPPAVPIAQAQSDNLSEAPNLPDDTGTEATDTKETGTEAKGAEATALPDPTPPHPQPDSPPVAAQGAQATPEAERADTPEPTEAPQNPEALPLAAPIALPIAPASPAPTGDSAPATAALSADTAPLAPLETSSAASLGTAEATPLAAPQAALPGSAPAPLTSAPLPQTLDLTAPQWPEQMVQDIRQGAATNTDSLTLTLTPERLGPLQIRLETLDGVTHVHIVTETPEAARAIAEAQPRLAEAMARAGLEMGTQSTTTTTAGGSGGASGFGADTNPRGNGQPTPAQSLPNETSIADEAPPPPLSSPRQTARASIDLIA